MSGTNHNQADEARTRSFVGTPLEEWERLVHEQDELMAATMKAAREVRRGVVVSGDNHNRP